MVTDKDTQLQIMSQITRKLLDMVQIDKDDFMKREFQEALTAKYNAFKYPKMHVTITHQ